MSRPAFFPEFPFAREEICGSPHYLAPELIGPGPGHVQLAEMGQDVDDSLKLSEILC